MKTLCHEMGTTFIVATHDPRMAQRCDRSIELLDGRINHGESSLMSHQSLNAQSVERQLDQHQVNVMEGML